MGGALVLHPKVVGGSLSGACGVLCVWLLGLAHVGVDPIVASALTVVLGGFGAWLAPLAARIETGASGGGET